VQDKHVDVSAHVERVKRRTRPWRAIIALVLAIAAAVASYYARNSLGPFKSSRLPHDLIADCTAAAFLVFAIIATYGLAGKTRGVLEPKVGTPHAAIVRYAILIIGGFTTLVITLELFGVPAQQLILGGALTTVFLSIAAQQALSNVFAGMVLLLARPFQVGDPIRLRAGALGGTLDGVVIDIGVTYVRFRTNGSVMSIPNSQVLNAVVGPIPPADVDRDRAPATTGTPSTPGSPGLPQPGPPGPV
jgi:small-conductance mechanosensitive channel